MTSVLSLIKEGSFVHIASCVGNIVSRLSSKYEDKKGAWYVVLRDVDISFIDTASFVFFPAQGMLF